MLLSDKKGIQQIVFALAALDLKEVVICPGSRSAPLVISFNRHPGFHCTSIRDERSAGFYALGKAMELKQPVALLCTSGSAALNFAPAVSEAYYQRIPLIVLTADRPAAWINQGDGQTIDQTGIYRNYIRADYELNGDASSPADLWHIERCVSEGFNKAVYSDKGPVHFNVPLNEPLYHIEDVKGVAPRIFKQETTDRRLSEQTLLELSSCFSSCKKIMILVGQHPMDKDFQEVIAQMSTFGQLIVLTETTSNIHHPNFIENTDRCITGLDDLTAETLRPELLITVGGAIVSKRVKTFLRNNRPDFHWNVHPFDSTMDTYQSLTSAISMEPVVFFRNLQQAISNVSSGYRETWWQLKEERERLHQDYIAHCGYSDLKVFHEIYQHAPEDICLHIANSSAIRYAQLFNNTAIAETFCNRGTSGIDGCTSTAMGSASASPDKTFLLITGDVAFYYDMNALWNDEAIRNLKIIIINNGGGGIFRIIEGPDKIEERSQFLETAMYTNSEKIAHQFNWDYLSAKDEESLAIGLKQFFDKGSKRIILEIFTEREQNPVVLENYWKYLRKNKL